jgi:hypothetical protein
MGSAGRSTPDDPDPPPRIRGGGRVIVEAPVRRVITRIGRCRPAGANVAEAVGAARRV